MGLHLSARCPCGYARDGLLLGGTHAMIGAHDVSCYEVFRVLCCGEVQSALIYMGAELPADVACDRCGGPLELATERRYRISTLKGEHYEGHVCPRCGGASLEFRPGATFV